MPADTQRRKFSRALALAISNSMHIDRDRHFHATRGSMAPWFLMLGLAACSFDTTSEGGGRGRGRVQSKDAEVGDASQRAVGERGETDASDRSDTAREAEPAMNMGSGTSGRSGGDKPRNAADPPATGMRESPVSIEGTPAATVANTAAEDDAGAADDDAGRESELDAATSVADAAAPPPPAEAGVPDPTAPLDAAPPAPAEAGAPDTSMPPVVEDAAVDAATTPSEPDAEVADAGPPPLSSRDRQFQVDLLDVVVTALQSSPSADPADLLVTLTTDVEPDADVMADVLDFVDETQDCNSWSSPCQQACNVVETRCEECRDDDDCRAALRRTCDVTGC